jgi:hypothetical protein
MFLHCNMLSSVFSAGTYITSSCFDTNFLVGPVPFQLWRTSLWVQYPSSCGRLPCGSSTLPAVEDFLVCPVPFQLWRTSLWVQYPSSCGRLPCGSSTLPAVEDFLVCPVPFQLWRTSLWVQYPSSCGRLPCGSRASHSELANQPDLR